VFEIENKVKHEIYTNSDQRIKQYGLLFQFISTNLKEINEMVNEESIDQAGAGGGGDKKKLRNKEEELRQGLSVLNKIDEVNSNKLSSLSSFKILHSKKDSNDFSSSIKNSNSNSNDKNLNNKNKKVRKKKPSHEISSVNSEQLKNIIEDSGVGVGVMRGNFSEEISSIKSQEDLHKARKIETNINNNTNNNFIDNSKMKSNANYQFNFYIKNINNTSSLKKGKIIEKSDSIDLDKTKENFPFQDHESVEIIVKNKK